MENTEQTVQTAPAEEPRRLRRSRTDRMAAGVCGGLAAYFGLHPAIYRIIFVALAFAGGTGLILYAAATLVIPDDGTDDSIAAQALREHRERPWLVIGVALVALAGIFYLSAPHRFLWPGGGGLWIAALVVGALIISRESRRRAASAGPATTEVRADAATAPAARQARRPVVAAGIGMLLVGAGVLGLLDALDVVGVDWLVALAGAVILVGVLAFLGLFWGGSGALALIGVLLALVMGAALVLDDVPLRGGIGDRTEHPTAVTDLSNRYRLGIGKLEVDLSDLKLPSGETTLASSVGMGQLIVDVPRDVAVRVDAKVRAGDTRILGRRDDGWTVREQVSTPAYEHATRKLDLEAKVGFGELVVQRR